MSDSQPENPKDVEMGAGMVIAILMDRLGIEELRISDLDMLTFSGGIRAWRELETNESVFRRTK
jgi:hypothetical protein